MTRKILIIFCAALAIRLYIHLIVNNPLGSQDAHTYYTESQTFKLSDWTSKRHITTSYMGEDRDTYSYLVRSPAYILYLYLTQRNLYLQIFINVLAIVLLFRINKVAGWIYCFYPVNILDSIMYHKEAVMIPLVILSLYLIKNKWILVPTILLIVAAFQSYGTVVTNTFISSHQGVLQNIWELWKPVFTRLPSWWNYILFIPYSFMMFMFIRKQKIWSYQFELFCIWTVVYGLIYGLARYREPLIPVILLSVIRLVRRET